MEYGSCYACPYEFKKLIGSKKDNRVSPESGLTQTVGLASPVIMHNKRCLYCAANK